MAVLLSTLLSLVGTSCLHRPPNLKLTTPTPIAVAYVVDRRDQPGGEVAQELIDKVNAALVSRNLQPQQIPAEVYGPTFLSMRSSPQRLAFIANQAGNAPLVLLVEIKPIFYDFLNGRFKWSVYFRLTLSKREDLSSAATDETEEPVFLLLDHEKEREAQQAAATAVGERVEKFIDSFLGGRPDFPSEPIASNEVGAAK
jgi:hypothetical protein